MAEKKFDLAMIWIPVLVLAVLALGMFSVGSPAGIAAAFPLWQGALIFLIIAVITGAVIIVILNT